ncbi:two-partner secretion domain-containing protein [Coleofasciculus sp. G2-EDA-02]|uniref:two-partner secretion domain-containing protein n=1 Tax=Coleofasciculus sp. G2-EDA-02 TaxID=3069529 RepID=UPI0032FDEA75
MNSPFLENSTGVTCSYLAQIQSSKPRYWQLGLASFFTSLTVLISQDTPLRAQITPDNTLEAESSVVTPNAQVRGRLADLIEGGAIREANLFHSFLEFNIEERQRVYFANPVGIETIFSRVTGNNPSAILGTLGVNGEANLFFLNPNGIIFGENAQLDIQGSFVASTANSVVFEDGSSFSATNPEDSSLLTISVPLGLQYGQPAAVVNAGNLAVGEGENLTLAGGTVVNSGQLSAPGGTISLAAVPSQGLIHLDLTGQITSVDLPLNNDTNPVLSSASGLATLLENAGLTEADIPIDFNLGTVAILGSVDASNPLGSGGEINVTGNRIQLLNGVINSGGVTGGEINLTSTFLENRGEIQADGERGGSVTINVTNFLDTGVLSATGNAGDGGTIQVDYQGTVIQTATALTSVTGSEKAGRIRFQGGQVFTTSGNLQAQGELGGEIQLFGERLQLLGTGVNASGNQGGGEILVGGDYQGNTVGAENADYTLVNHGTRLQADGLRVGDGGKVIVWADGETDFYGNLTARGGALAGNGGVLEVSGKGSLVFGGFGEASAANGVAGELLLDPKNITIDTANTGASFQLLNPNPAPGNQFGFGTAVLPNGNIVVSSPQDDLMAEDAGAVYLFDSNTGAILGSIHGANPGDKFGDREITALNNGNYVFGNRFADIGGVEDAGTVILANGTTGAEISRISGTNGIDRFGSDGITALSNGNYVFANQRADIGGVENAGTVILANGSTGAEISRISNTGIPESVGYVEIIALSNGNYVFGNLDADIGGVGNAGTVILADGTTGAEISRISGTNGGDAFGSDAIIALSNGNYVFGNHLANIGGVRNAGTVILADGTTGAEISRISGTNTNDWFGWGEITALSNGNYVFGNNLADIGGVKDAGTVILADGTTGAEISRISGTNPDDNFGRGEITALSNGNYVFGNHFANIGGVVNAGTVILADGTTGAEIDRISGTNPEDFFGNSGITDLSNGNYVFGNPNADIEGVQNAGTVILANGTTGTEINRISGTNPEDFFGNGDIRILSDGNYVFANPNADIGGVVDAGTVILADGTTGEEISRLSGTNRNDKFGSGGITALSNGNYLVASPAANNGAGQVDIGIANPSSSLTHSYFPNRNITLTPSTITRITDTGTAVTLQANNDITVNQAIITDNPTGSGGALSLEAGRSILLNADITTDNGNLSLLGNQPLAAGVINSEREPGAAEITMKPDTTINTGFGDVTIELDTGEGLTHNTVGTITLDNINAETLTVDSAGAILGNGILSINSDATFTTTLANAGTVSVTNTNPTTIGYSIIGGNFRLNSPSPISHAPGEPLQVAGNISVNGDSSNPLINSLALPTSPIEENGNLIITQVGTVNLPTNTVTGNLTVNSLPGAVLSFNTVLDNPAITLNQANSFGGSLRFQTSKDGISTTGIPGITQSGSLDVSGTATFNAENGTITLNDSNNQFGTLAFTGKDIAIRENGTTNLLNSTATGNLNLIADRGISQDGNLTVTGTSNFTTLQPDAPITLTNNNQLTGDIHFTTNGTGNVTLLNTLATQLAASNVYGNLTITSGGAITQTEPLNLTGITTLKAGNSDIILNQNNDFRTLSINGGRNVRINDRNDINLINSSVSGNFNVNARGDITSQNIFNPSGSITLTSTNGSIDTTQGTLRTFSLGAGGAIALSAQGNITLGNLDARGVNGGGNITLTSQGRIASANSFIRSSTMSPSSDSGQAGDITIQAESVSLTDTILSASTLGSGKGGTITINAAEFVELLNDSLVLTTTTGNGDAGDIEITTSQLNIFNGSQIGTATVNQGAGGNIIVNASDTIRIAGTAADGVPSGLFTAALSGSTGVAGDLAIATQTLSLENGSQISARSQGEGDAGKIALTIADTLTATNSSILTATDQSAGGAINITAADIRLWGDSDITTSVSSGGDNGGNIMITADSILAFADSDILAFARDGRGGDITLNTPIFFGFGYTPAAKGTDPATLDHNQRVDINADAAIDGIITIPDLTFIENSLIDLPDNFIDSDNLIANSCMVRADQQNGRFIITGAGNLPLRPGDLTISPYPTGTVRMIPTESTTRPWQKGDPIVESTGVYRLPDGRLVMSRDCS